MADFTKKPLGRSVNQVAERRAADAIHSSGRSLPCSVVAVVSSGIVTVSFEVDATPFTLPRVTVPIAVPSYIRYPVSVGDKGLVIAADARLGGVSGLGTGTANLSEPGNLTALAFVWLGSTSWAGAMDPEALEIMTNVSVKGDALGFFGEASVPQQEVTGPLSAVTNPAAKAVLTSLIAALAASGLIRDSTT